MAITMLLLFLLLTIGLFALFFGFDDMGAQARTIRERLSAVDTAAKRNPSEQLALLRDDLLSEIPALQKVLKRSAHVSRLQRFLGQAEIRMRVGKFLLVSLCSGAAAAVLILFITRSHLFAFVAFAAAAAVPFAVVAYLRGRRFNHFIEIFPEAIDLLARAVRAGHAFNTAVELTGQEMPEPVSGEFRRVYDEMRFGIPIRDAMLNLVDRVPLIDVKFFVTAVLLQRETGGNLAELLDKLSYVIRERFKILRQVRVYTAQGRMTMLILMALPPACVLMMWGLDPEFIKPLFTDPIGRMLLVTGVCMQFTGFLLIRKIIRIEV